ncbi:hypothetical protein [Amedibacillus sp. YH-ame10]
MNVRSKILKIRNLPTSGHKIAQIKAKPYGFILLFLCFGIALLCTRFFIVGIIISVIFCYYLLFVKDMLLIDFYDTHAVFYLNNGNDECFLLFWEDIYHWEITSTRKDLDVLNIILKNNQTYQLKCLGRKKIEQYFAQYADEACQKTSNEQHAL